MKWTGTEIGGVAVGSPLRHSNATRPAVKANTKRADAASRRGFFLSSELFRKPVLNRNIPEARETSEIAVGGNERQSIALGNSSDP